MKKWLKIAFLALVMFIGVFGFTGCGSTPNIDIRVQNGYVQYLDENGSWLNIISVEELKGADGQDGQDGSDGINAKLVEFRTTDTYIQWRYVGDSAWKNLSSLEEIKGDTGKDGSTWYSGTTYPSTAKENDFFLNTSENKIYEYNGTTWEFQTDIDGQDGIDGKQVEFNVTDTYIQWRYVGTTGWTNLIALEDIKPELNKYSVFFDYNIPINNYYLSYENYSVEDVVAGTCVDFPEIDQYLSRYLIGWFAGDSVDDVKYTEHSLIGRDVSLYAQWDVEKLEKDMYRSGAMKIYFNEDNNNCIVCNLEDNVPSGYILAYDASGVRDSFVSIPGFITVISKGNKIYPVTSILSASFDDDSSITSVHIPATIDNVGSTFIRLTNLTTLTISNGIKSFSQSAFYGCTSLSKVYLPDSLSLYVSDNSTRCFSNCNASIKFYCLRKNTSVLEFSKYVEVISGLTFGEYSIFVD